MEIFYRDKKYRVEVSKYLKGGSTFISLEEVKADNLIPISTNPFLFPSLKGFMGPKRVFLLMSAIERNPGLLPVLVDAQVISAPIEILEATNREDNSIEIIAICDIL